MGDIADLGCVQTSSHFRPPDWAAEGDAPPAAPPPAPAPSFQPPPSRTGRVPAMRTEPADAEVAKLQERVAQLAAESRQRQQEKRRRLRLQKDPKRIQKRLSQGRSTGLQESYELRCRWAQAVHRPIDLLLGQAEDDAERYMPLGASSIDFLIALGSEGLRHQLPQLFSGPRRGFLGPRKILQQFWGADESLRELT